MGDVSMLQGTSILVRPESHRMRPRYSTFPPPNFRRALAEIPAVSKTIVDALIMRRRRVSRYREFAGCVYWLRGARVTDISSTIFWIRITSRID